MDDATAWIPIIATSQPQLMPAVPAYPIPYHSVVAKLGSSPRTANETQNVVHRVNSLLNSGLYLQKVEWKGQRMS